LKALQVGCFRYFELGGQCIDGPVGLLGGIIRQPLVLVYHFFAVALYSIWIYVTSGNPIALPFRAIASVGVFWKACVVIFPFIFSELRA
jgi:squalene monooxygenase